MESLKERSINSMILSSTNGSLDFLVILSMYTKDNEKPCKCSILISEFPGLEREKLNNVSLAMPARTLGLRLEIGIL